MLQTLEHRAQLVALEAHATNDVLGLIGGVFDDVRHAFAGFADRFSPSQPGLQLSGDASTFLKEVNKHSYVGLRAVTAYVPEGLNVSYPEYLDTLAAPLAHVYAMPEQVLFPFAKFLAGIVTNRELATSGERIDLRYANLPKQRSQFNTQLGRCFLVGSHRAERKLSDVVARNADWEDVFKRADGAAQGLNRIDRKVLDRKVKECVELLDAVQRKIERHEFGDMSSQVANMLANGTFQVASELEFYSVIYFKVQALLGAMNRTTEHLRFVFAQ